MATDSFLTRWERVIKGDGRAARSGKPQTDVRELVQDMGYFPPPWQPMATFPRDGEAYLVCDRRILDGFHQVVFWHEEAKNKWCLATSDGPTFHFDAFTDWMKLPKPPAFPE